MKPVRAHIYIVVSLLGLMAPAITSAESLWQHLEQSGRSLDIMGIQAMGQYVSLVGTRYVEAPLQPPGEPEPVVPPAVRKQLYVMRFNRNEIVQWQQQYPALPDAQEIFSISKGGDMRMCIVYGELPGHEQALNPVLVQINESGKIVWATRNVMAENMSHPSRQAGLLQIANLDAVKVIATQDGGCLLAFVTRFLTTGEESFYLNIISYDSGGAEKWRKSIATEYFGRMYLVNNRQVDQYVVVQTNQSRDAAIQAMMLGMPFRPATMISGFNQKGEILFQYENLPELEKVWIKTVSDAQGSSIILAGKSTVAWTAHIDAQGKVTNLNDRLEGEFHAATATLSGGFAFVRGEYLTITDGKLNELSSKKISAITSEQYVNKYLNARLPDDLPAQQILELGKNNYLVLFKLGSKLLKIHSGVKN